jgi:YggT family protein
VELAARILELVVRLFIAVLLVRVVLDWVQVLAREWRPRGFVLIVAEVVYTITDPPVRALRRVIPPVTIGTIRLDVAFIVLFVLCWLALVLLAMV